jgi:hypothetical protein
MISPSAQEAQERAAPRARRRGGPVELKHLVEPPPAKAWSEVVDNVREMLPWERKTARGKGLLARAIHVNSARREASVAGSRTRVVLRRPDRDG